LNRVLSWNNAFGRKCLAYVKMLAHLCANFQKDCFWITIAKIGESFTFLPCLRVGFWHCRSRDFFECVGDFDFPKFCCFWKTTRKNSVLFSLFSEILSTSITANWKSLVMSATTTTTTTTTTTKQQPKHLKEQNTNSLVTKNKLDTVLVCSFWIESLVIEMLLPLIPSLSWCRFFFFFAFLSPALTVRHESFSSRLNDGSHHRSLSGLSVEPHAQVLDLHSWNDLICPTIKKKVRQLKKKTED